MKLQQLSILESTRRAPIPQEISQLIPKLVQVAQSTYDDWDESLVDVYANGGICHLIADEMAAVFNEVGIDATTVSAEIGEVHVWTVVKIHNEDMEQDCMYEVDIPPHVYETGGGYNWQKIPDVTFKAQDIHVGLLCCGQKCVDSYFEQW